MIKVVFKNLEKSELIRNLVLERLLPIIEKFPNLKNQRATATLSMENSPQQAGADVFGIRLMIKGKRNKNIFLEKKSLHLHVALAELCHVLLERINRQNDRIRAVIRGKQRRFLLAE